ncbi:MAG: glycosyltransferase family 2 protein [Elainellaceae cyanobacterium]
MNIHGICIVKNEADIIEQTLTHAATWCDFIYVFDNGSTDGTWEKVLDLSKRYSPIIPYKQDDCVFHDWLRSEVFHHFRSNSIEGDWWCRLDADEFYIDDPRIFLKKVPQSYQCVWSASFSYYFTDKDLERYNHDPSLYADDVPVSQKYRYYLNNWSEPRFCRYDKNLIWDRSQEWPYFGAVYPVRIWLKHYRYRSPQQIQKRVSDRQQAQARGNNGFRHEAQSDWLATVFNPFKMSSQTLTVQCGDDTWKERIVDSSQLFYDAHDQNYVVREDLMPKLPTWSPFIANKMRSIRRHRILRKYIDYWSIDRRFFDGTKKTYDGLFWR